MNLETASQIATIIAAVIASGAIINWVRNKYFEKHPFKVHRFVFSRSRDDDNPAYFRVDLKNVHPNDITVNEVYLMTRTKHCIRELDGNLDISSLSSYVVHATLNESKVIKTGAKEGFIFEYQNTSDADNDFPQIDSVSIRTDHGPFSCRLGKADLWESRGGLLGYSDHSFTTIGKYLNLLRYYWWKHCLSEETQKEFKLHNYD